MFIKKLILTNYERLFLAGIKELVLEPQSIIHIILGQNGVGKSSVLSTLNPLPADIKKDYYEDGGKYIEITHNGNEYILESGRSLGHKHSFIFNGIELNTSGLKTIQLKLVEEHFNLTPIVNNIINGYTKFTILPANERKKIFQDISNVDYSYPIKFYNNLKTRHRDIIGGIKTLQDNIIKTESFILKDEEVIKKENDLKYIKEYIEHIISLYDHTVVNSISIDKLKLDIDNIEKETNKILRNITNNKSKKELETECIILQNEVVNNKIRIEEIENKLSVIDKNYIQDEKLIEEELQELDKVLSKSNFYIMDVDVNNVENINSMFSDIKVDFLNIVNELNEYNDVISKKEDYEEFINNINRQHELNNSKIKKLEELKLNYNHMLSLKTDDNKITCVNCNHTWFQHYDSKVEKEIVTLISNLEKDYEEFKIKYDKLLEEETKVKNKQEIIKKLKLLISSNNILKPIWVHILSNYNIHNVRSKTIVAEVNKITLDLDTWVSYSIANKRKEELIKNLELVRKTNMIIKNTLDKNIDELEKELTIIFKRQNTIDSILSYNKKIINHYNNLEINKNKLDSYINKYNEVIKQSSISIRNRFLTDLVNELKKTMLDLEHSIKLNDNFKSKYISETNQIENLKIREKVTKLLCKELSPNEGLIAKSINSFLNMFIKDMNGIINKIWEYDIEILPFEINNEEDLDYSFKVKVDGKKPIEDVSKLSTSMMEIVDLAFRIVYIKYKKLSDFPLILDEFARTFDKVHANKAYDTIGNVFANNFQQIFLVSHFQTMYGRFINSDITILGSDEMYKDDF